MPKFERCKEAHEISLVRAGANQHAHVLIRKSKKDPANPVVENEMTAEEIKKAALAAVTEALSKGLSMSDVSKAHFLTLNEDAKAAFLEKSADEQTAEAEKAKADADKAKEAEAAKAKGQTEREAQLEKRHDELVAEIAELKKKDASRDIEADLEKAAADPAYAGYPGGTDALKVVLKTARGLSDETARDAILGLAKNQAQMARTTTVVRGLNPLDTDLEKKAPATARVEKRVKELMTEKSITREAAMYELTQDQAYKADVVKALDEETAFNAAQ